jgi:hypothetical protein
MEQAEACLMDFIRESDDVNDPHNIAKHSHGYDLYLPWFMEIVEFRAPNSESEALVIPELQRLYMDAAWSLVMKGILRPGPKTVTGDSNSNAYGKGYCLVEHR